VAVPARSTAGVYTVMLIDAIFVKIRDGSVANRPIYVAMGPSGRLIQSGFVGRCAPPRDRRDHRPWVGRLERSMMDMGERPGRSGRETGRRCLSWP